MRVVHDFEDLERKLDRLMTDPTNPQLFNEIGIILYQLKDEKSALMYFERAYELCPLDGDILYNYGVVLHVQYKWRKAISIYQDYLQLYPDDNKIIEKMGEAYYQLGDYDLAANMYGMLQKI